ncbi:dTDP-4-dehydrorhamnose reductase family protein [Rubinisphaera italica]|nr:SDR family oxidoreductase [Rubinisphaera italica]
MKILIIGSTGMLGHALVRKWHRKYDLAVTTRLCKEEALQLLNVPEDNVEIYDYIDVNEIDRIEEIVSQVLPKNVINCVGIVKQDDLSSKAIPSIRINSLFPHLLYSICEKYNSRLIQISTDCVFSGSKKRPYAELDIPDPIDLYGRSKLLGEIQERGLTLRTSIIGKELIHKRGLLEWFFLQEGQTVKGYKNALFSGFTTTEFANVLSLIIDKYYDMNGVWHVSSNPISKYELLVLINRIFQLNVTVESDAEYFCDRRLCSDKFQKATRYIPPGWNEMLQVIKDEIDK